MGRDRFGTKRGKCGLCEKCYEYTPPADGTTLACDYCDHKPIYHILVVPLGVCECGLCHGYISRFECQYTSCGYCNCSADMHLGYARVQLEVDKAIQRLYTPNASQVIQTNMNTPIYDIQPQMMNTQSSMYSENPSPYHSNQTQPLPNLYQNEPQENSPNYYSTKFLKYSVLVGFASIIALFYSKK